MTGEAPIAITGATGYIGSHIARLLAERGIPQRLIARDPARLPSLPAAQTASISSYSDAQEMRESLEGADTLFLVSAHEAPDRVQQHKTAVDAAIAAGVQRIVYLSFLNASPDATFTFARDHFATEEYIRASGARYTFLRDGPYLDFLPMMPGPDGVIRGPADDGRAALVARDDVVTVAAMVLADGGHDGVAHDIVGREALTLAECAALLSEVTGRAITFHDETVEEAWESRAQYGAADWAVEGWVSTYLAIATGKMGPPSDIIERLTGTPAQTLAEFLRAHPESYQHLLPISG